MRKLMTDREVGLKIASLIEASSPNDQMRDTAHSIRMICQEMGPRGWFVITSEKGERVQVAWTKEEEERLIEILSIYRGTEHYVYGQKKRLWAVAGEELGRPPTSVKTKYNELVRKGKIRRMEDA